MPDSPNENIPPAVNQKRIVSGEPPGIRTHHLSRSPGTGTPLLFGPANQFIGHLAKQLSGQTACRLRSPDIQTRHRYADAGGSPKDLPHRLLAVVIANPFGHRITEAVDIGVMISEGRIDHPVVPPFRVIRQQGFQFLGEERIAPPPLIRKACLQRHRITLDEPPRRSQDKAGPPAHITEKHTKKTGEPLISRIELSHMPSLMHRQKAPPIGTCGEILTGSRKPHTPTRNQADKSVRIKPQIGENQRPLPMIMLPFKPPGCLLHD